MEKKVGDSDCPTKDKANGKYNNDIARDNYGFTNTQTLDIIVNYCKGDQFTSIFDTVISAFIYTEQLIAISCIFQKQYTHDLKHNKNLKTHVTVPSSNDTFGNI